MKTYELSYLISSEISEEETKKVKEKIASLIQNHGGVLVKESLAAKKNLAYPVKNQSQAYLVSLDFQITPENLAALEKPLKSEEKILRHLVLTKKKTKIAKPARKAPKSIRKTTATTTTKPKIKLKEIEEKLEEILKDEPR